MWQFLSGVQEDFISYDGESMTVSFPNVRRSVMFVKDI